MRTVVIANPIAGPGRGRVTGSDAAALLRGEGLEPRLLETGGPGDATRLAAGAAAEGAECCVAVGGDGTVHEVACGLSGTGCALGVFPSGSGNDFAVGNGCSTVSEGLLAVVSGRTVAVDACALDDLLFFNSAGLLASGLVSGRAAGISRIFGRNRYQLASVATLLSYRGQPLEWQISGGEEPGTLTGDFMLIEVCNGPLTGGGFRFAPDADFQDGILDACMIRPLSPLTSLRLLPAAGRGERLEHPAVSLVRGREMVFTADRPVAYHVDGEPGVLESGRHSLRILEEKLLVRRPTDS